MSLQFWHIFSRLVFPNLRDISSEYLFVIVKLNTSIYCWTLLTASRQKKGFHSLSIVHYIQYSSVWEFFWHFVVWKCRRSIEILLNTILILLCVINQLVVSSQEGVLVIPVAIRLHGSPWAWRSIGRLEDIIIVIIDSRFILANQIT